MLSGPILPVGLSALVWSFQGFIFMPVSIKSFSFSVWASINTMKPQIDSRCLCNSSSTVKLKMQICVMDDVITHNAQKALFSDNVSFRCEFQKTSKKVAFITPKVRFFSSTTVSACFFKPPLLVKHCYCSFKQFMELKNTWGQLSTSSGVNWLGQVTHLDVTPRHTPDRSGSPTTTKLPKVRHFTFLLSRFMSWILLVVCFCCGV